MYTQTELKTARTSVSVGICATTELENAPLLADVIMGLDDPQMTLKELIIATPNLRLAMEMAERHPRLVTELETRREGKTAALNRILSRASGDIIVLASADIKIARSTIPRLVKGLLDHPDWGAVDSRVELVNGDTLLMDKISNLLWEVHNRTLDELDGNGRLGHIAGDLLAVRRELTDKLPDVINDDAYLALRVQEKGFRVRRVQDALVWIAGPRSPTDHVCQRSRVLRGHLQLFRLFGKMPSTFEFQLLRSPRQYLGLLVKTIARHGARQILPVFIAGLLELLSIHMALVSSLIGRKYKPWRIALTTKRI